MAKVQASRTAEVSVTSNEVTDWMRSELVGGLCPSKPANPSTPFPHLSLAKKVHFLPRREIIANNLTETIKASKAIQERHEYVPFGERKVFDFCRSPKASTGDLTAAAEENDPQSSEIAKPACREICSIAGTKSSEIAPPSHPKPSDSPLSDQLTKVAQCERG